MKKTLSFKRSLPFLMAGFFCFSQGGSAQTTAAPPPPSKATTESPVGSQLTPQERENLDKQMKKYLEEMTPEQRKAAGENLKRELTPAQKEALKRQMQGKWEKMTPEQKKEVRAQVQEKLRSAASQETDTFINEQKMQMNAGMTN